MELIISSNVKLIIFFIAIRGRENDVPIKSSNPLAKQSYVTIPEVSLKQPSIVVVLWSLKTGFDKNCVVVTSTDWG